MGKRAGAAARGAAAPHFVLFGNQIEELPASYERFLINGLRKTFDLPGAPIRISRKAGDNPFAEEKRG